MSSKHTPGPWTYDDSEGRVYDARADQVCDLEASMSEADKLAAKDETRANARLIESAPELLAACKAAAMQIEGCIESYNMQRDKSPRYFNVADQLRSAIARAEGGGE